MVPSPRERYIFLPINMRDSLKRFCDKIVGDDMQQKCSVLKILRNVLSLYKTYLKKEKEANHKY